jgi:hypothetical protein
VSASRIPAGTWPPHGALPQRAGHHCLGGPLLGLLGTVIGMIQMFLGILDHGVGDVNQLAGGIGKALVCTATGMIVAVPALMFHRYFGPHPRLRGGDGAEASACWMRSMPRGTRRRAVRSRPAKPDRCVSATTDPG